MKKSILVVAVAALLLSNTGRGGVNFNDGGEHFIYYGIGEYFRIFNSYEGNPTIVNLVPGGVLLNGDVDDDSSLFVLGGACQGQIQVAHNATITVSSGSMNRIVGNNSGQINLLGGEVSDYIEIHGYSRLELSGGLLDGYLYLTEAAQAFVSGGIITGRIDNGQKDDSTIDTSVITIYGTGFNYPYGPIPDATGTLIGTLLNGDPINNGFRIYDNASIILAIPEPASLLLLGLGGLLIRKQKLFKEGKKWVF